MKHDISWIDALEPEDVTVTTDEDRARFAQWLVDPHHETADTLAVEDAADELAHKLGDA